VNSGADNLHLSATENLNSGSPPSPTRLNGAVHFHYILIWNQEAVRSALFWDITQHWVVVLYRRSGTIPSSMLKKSASLPLKMWPIDCPGTSIHNYHSTLRNMPEGCRFHPHRGGNLKSRKEQWLPVANTNWNTHAFSMVEDKDNLKYHLVYVRSSFTYFMYRNVSCGSKIVLSEYRICLV
jgi:hypothetical protein